MVLLNHSKFVIFAFPRSGTKLLSNILQSFGYHSYGEYFSILTTEIAENTAKRFDKDQILMQQNIAMKFDPMDDCINLPKMLTRYEKFSMIPNSVLTLWYENLVDLPFLLNKLHHTHWLCLKRDTKDQLLSWIVAFYNQNYDGMFVSKKVRPSKGFVEYHYWKHKKITKLQDWLINSGNGSEIKFEELVSGSYKGFGRNYKVTSMDEHDNISDYIENYDEVIDWIETFGQTSN